MRKRLYFNGLVVLLALASSGCGSEDIEGDWSNLTNYGDVQPQKIQFKEVTWGIVDRTEEERMLMVPFS